MIKWQENIPIYLALHGSASPPGFAPKVDCEKLGTMGKKITLFQLSQTEIAYTPFPDVKGDFYTLFRVRIHMLLSSTLLYSPFMGAPPPPPRPDYYAHHQYSYTLG